MAAARLANRAVARAAAEAAAAVAESPRRLLSAEAAAVAGASRRLLVETRVAETPGLARAKDKEARNLAPSKTLAWMEVVEVADLVVAAVAVETMAKTTALAPAPAMVTGAVTAITEIVVETATMSWPAVPATPRRLCSTQRQAETGLFTYQQRHTFPPQYF